MAFYDDMAALALRLITKFGFSTTYTVSTETEYDVEDGSQEGTDTTFQVNVIRQPVSTAKIKSGTTTAFDEEEDDGTLMRKRFYLIAGSDLANDPQPGDRITLDSEDWLVTGCTPINPAGTPLVYRIGVGI